MCLVCLEKEFHILSEYNPALHVWFLKTVGFPIRKHLKMETSERQYPELDEELGRK